MALPFFGTGALSLNFTALAILTFSEFIGILNAAILSTVLLLIGCCICGGVGQISLKLSYRYALASNAVPFEYSSILFALIFGYGLFGETPSLQMLIGVGIFIAASFIIISRKA